MSSQALNPNYTIKVGGEGQKWQEEDATTSHSRRQMTLASAIALHLASPQEKEAQ